MPGKKRPRLSLLAGVLLLCCAPELYAQNLQDRVKAAFVFNFAKFVAWPKTSFVDQRSKLQFCLLANQEFSRAVALAIEEASIDGRKLESRTVRRSEDLEGCHVAFIDGERANATEWLMAIKERSILSVSDAEDFIQNGGIIQFVLVDDKLRFEIHQGRALDSGLVVSSRLLQLAKAVHRD